MSDGLQRAFNATRATRGLPPLDLAGLERARRPRRAPESPNGSKVVRVSKTRLNEPGAAAIVRPSETTPPGQRLVILVTVPVKIVSLANLREHWGKRAARAKVHRAAALLALTAAANRNSIDRPSPPLVVRITRVAPRALDSDNAVGGAKNVRDGVADWLRLDDGDHRIRWEYAQRKGDYAATVEIFETANGGQSGIV